MQSIGDPVKQIKEKYIVDVNAALEQYSDMVYKISLAQTKNKHDAEDVFQEVFMRLAKRPETITSEEHLKAWLIRVTLNCCKKNFRFWRRNTTELTEDVASFTPEEYGLYQSVMDLPPKYRVVIHLFYYEDMPIKEICSILGVKESTIKSQLLRGRNLLIEALKGEFDQFGEPV